MVVYIEAESNKSRSKHLLIAAACTENMQDMFIMHQCSSTSTSTCAANSRAPAATRPKSSASCHQLHPPTALYPAARARGGVAHHLETLQTLASQRRLPSLLHFPLPCSSPLFYSTLLSTRRLPRRRSLSLHAIPLNVATPSLLVLFSLLPCPSLLESPSSVLFKRSLSCP